MFWRVWAQTSLLWGSGIPSRNVHGRFFYVRLGFTLEEGFVEMEEKIRRVLICRNKGRENPMTSTRSWSSNIIRVQSFLYNVFLPLLANYIPSFCAGITFREPDRSATTIVIVRRVTHEQASAP